jgi:hypothetical protein
MDGPRKKADMKRQEPYDGDCLKLLRSRIHGDKRRTLVSRQWGGGGEQGVDLE